MQIRLGLVLYAAIALVATAWTATLRGPWMDEFWSVYFAVPPMGFAEAFRTLWAYDVHPPLFSALSYLANGLVPIDFVTGRLLNIVPLALGAFYGWLWVRRMPEDRAFVTVFAVAVSGSIYMVFYLTEFRSYAMGAVAFAVLLVALRRLDDPAPLPANARGLVWSGVFVALFSTFNLQYFTALLTGITVAVFGLAIAARRDWRRFATLVGVSLLAMVPVALFLPGHMAFMADQAGVFWVDTSNAEAVRVFLRVVAKTLVQNPVLSLAAAAVVLAPLLGRALPAEARPRGLAMLWRLGLVWLLSAVAMLAINGSTPVVIERYLIPLSVVLTAGLASLAAPLLLHRQALFAAFVASTAVIVILLNLRYAENRRWDGTAELVAAEVAACPATRVIPVVEPEHETPNARDAHVFAYGRQAARWGFDVEGYAPFEGVAPVAGAACPTVLWAEHILTLGSTEAEARDRLQRQFPAFAGCAWRWALAPRANGAVVVLTDCT